jgi:hypothetical protein
LATTPAIVNGERSGMMVMDIDASQLCNMGYGILS